MFRYKDRITFLVYNYLLYIERVFYLIKDYKNLPVYIEDLEYIGREFLKECDFVIYRDDIPICMGTMEQCANFLNVTTNRIKKLTSVKQRDMKIKAGKSYLFAQKVPKRIVAYELGVTLEEYEEECKRQKPADMSALKFLFDCEVRE